MKPRITTTRQILTRRLKKQTSQLANIQAQIESWQSDHPAFMTAIEEQTMGSLASIDYKVKREYYDLKIAFESAQWKTQATERELDRLGVVHYDEIQTGDNVLDVLLTGALRMSGKKHRFSLLLECQNPKNAEGSCPYASAAAVREFELVLGKYKTRPDIQIYVSTEDIPGNPFFTGYKDGRLDQIRPDVIGYADRPIPGKFGKHVVTVYEREGVHYTIDFTARQYGYEEFPLIQKFVGSEIWRLDNALGTWSVVGEFDAAAVEAARQENAVESAA